ncbi:MAG: IS630 family transposase [Selenomonadaceae bacterium]|nr:IS630 family transposase [Selenomonadaceae bacterium]
MKTASESIRTAITEHTPDEFKLPYSLWSREAIQELIELKLKIKMPLRTITLYLQRWGMTCQRPAKRATKQSATAFKEFQEVTFPKIVSKAKKENGLILFGDETGICNQENYQRGFSPAGVAPVVNLPAKKERINMISAISRQGHCEFMCYRENMTQQLLIEFLGRLISSYNRKIFLILDNLKVHHGKMVAEWVAERKNRIELFFFPSYSPQLNPDEYLNNMLKKDVHSGKIPHTKEQLEKKTQIFMNKISHQPEKISNLFLHENLSFIEGCFVA